jgi:hypothetical protein
LLAKANVSKSLQKLRPKLLGVVGHACDPVFGKLRQEDLELEASLGPWSQTIKQKQMNKQNPVNHFVYFIFKWILKKRI